MKPVYKYLFLIVLLAAVGTGFFALPKTHRKTEIFQKTTEGSNTTTYNPPTTTLFFGGDIMLSRNVAAKIYATNDFTLPFENIASEISKADIAFANLESPFGATGNHAKEGSLIFNADPQSVAGLATAGFDILSTANNHAFDQGKTGVDFTIQILEQNNILPLGTGLDCHTGQIVNKNGIKFGFLGYSYTALNDGGKTTNPLVCDANNLKQIAKDIQIMKPEVDYLVVSTHMGVEYTRTPTQAGIAFAHNAIDAGADLVIGNHPHWVQTIEEYRGKWIFYAMGNLVFDQMWSRDTREGLTLLVTYDNDKKEIQKIELKPVIIDNFCCPRWATEEETKSILKKISLTSTELYSTIR